MLSRRKKRPVKNRIEPPVKNLYIVIYLRAHVLRVAFSFYFLRVEGTRRDESGILFKLEMFSKRITICGDVGIGNKGSRRFECFMFKFPAFFPEIYSGLNVFKWRILFRLSFSHTYLFLFIYLIGMLTAKQCKYLK